MQRIELSRPENDAALKQALAALRGQLQLIRCPDEVLVRLVQRGWLVSLAPDEMLIREGDFDAPEMYLLVDGTLLVKSSGRLILTLKEPGEIVGELAVLQSPPRTADVIAAGVTRAVAIRPAFLTLPEFADTTALFYMMLSLSLARKLRATATQSRRQLEQLSREAATDSLTGLANRKRLDEYLAALRVNATASGSPFSLIILDIDHFKHYNDSNGHLKGDAVLAKVGLVLQAHARAGDLAARYGGEEFVLVLPDCDVEHAMHVAARLRELIALQSFPHAEAQPLGCVTASFGVASARTQAEMEDVLARADQALYRAKAAGRNVVVRAG